MNDQFDVVLHDPNGDASVIFAEGVDMTFFTESPRVKGYYGSSRTEKIDPNMGSGYWAFWGTANDAPQQTVREVNESDLLRPLIRKQTKTMIGQGVVYGTYEVNPTTGDQRLKPIRQMEIDLWLKRTNIYKYLYESWIDWTTHGNAFTEFQMSYGGQIAGLYAQDAVRCRLSKKDTNGFIRHCGLYGDWPNGVTDEKKLIKLPALDPDYDVAGQIRSSTAARMIMPIRLIVDDNDYYGQAPWHGLITSGWIDVAKAIPKLKKYLMSNMMLIKYHIEIAREYWPLAIEGWAQLSAKKQKEKKEEVVKAFTKWAAGEKSAGRTLMTEKVLDEIKKETYRSLWTVTPLKLEIPTGAYVEDSQEADFHVVRAFMDPALFGIAPGKDRNSAGSGSDKRIAHTQHILDNFIDTQLMLNPLDVVTDVNGWHEKYGNGQMIHWELKSYHVATADRTLAALTPDPNNQQN